MQTAGLFNVYRLQRIQDAKGGWGGRYVLRPQQERGRASAKALTSARSLETISEGGRGVANVSHVGYFRAAADISRGDLVCRSDVVLDERGEVTSWDSDVGPSFVAEVVSRRVTRPEALEAEFEMIERQRGV